MKDIDKNAIPELTDLDLSQIAVSDIVNHFTTLGKNILIALVVYLIGRFLVKYAMKALEALIIRRRLEPTLATFLHSLLSILLNLLLAITIVGVLGIDTSSFLAVFASAGVAIGMALSGTLQNFAGGVLILLLKPYKVGDYIEAQGGAGTVKAIQIFNTVLTTTDNQTIIIPNGALATGSLKNSTAAATRRVDINVEVAYGNETDKVRDILKEIIYADKRIIQSPTELAPYIPLTEMSASSIVFQVRIWTDAPNYWPVKFDLTERIYTTLTAAGIEIPFQQVDVHIRH